MNTNNFFINILVRIILLFFTLFTLAWVLQNTNRIFTPITIIIISLIEFYNLLYYINKTNRNLAKFLVYLKENDTSLAFSQGNIAKTFKELNTSFDEINKKIQKTKLDNEYQNILTKHIVNQIPVGILVFSENNEIIILNNNAKQILNIEKGCKKIEDLNFLRNNFSEFIQQLPKNQNRLYQIKNQDHAVLLSCKASEIIINKKKLRLISFQNIKKELEQRENESWQKLIRVLTHEIMNSITPITTLTGTIKHFFKKGERNKMPEEIDCEVIEDTLEGINIIEERGKGLMEFVNRYRSFTILPQPEKSIFSLESFFKRIVLLMQKEAENKKIKITYCIFPINLELEADKTMLEQVIINLVRNAVEAGKNRGVIFLKAEKTENSLIIEVENDGKKIPSEIIDEIFIPFYTTKEKGSGIGLSLSRQILQLHRADISVNSNEKRTIFRIEF